MTLLLAMLPLLAGACKTGREIPYEEAHHYYAIHGVEKTKWLVIETQEEFEKYFNQAAIMRKDGEPTSVDFSKSFVLGILLPDTDRPTVLSPVSLIMRKGRLVYTFQTEEESPTGFTSRPSLLIIVDKTAFSPQIEWNEIKK